MILLLDTETTGTDRGRDQVIELCLQTGLDGEPRSRRFRPSIPIPAEATAVHGITNADVAECLPFSAYAKSIAETLAASEVIAGYNVAFDLDMLQAEFSRAGLPPLDLASKQIIDAYQLWRHFEPRTLSAAHARFVGAPLDNAHSAAADTQATGRVLRGMLEHWGLADRSWPEIAALADPMPDRAQWVGPSAHIQRDNGSVVIAFGKNRGVPVSTVDQGFLSWVIGKDFPPHVKAICRAALDLPSERFAEWVNEKYPLRRTA